MEYSQYCQRHYPGMKVTAEVMQASDEKRALASMVGYAQMAGFALAFFGQPIFAALNSPEPDWAKYLQENKGLAIGGFFMGNIVVGNLVQTGAAFPGKGLHMRIEFACLGKRLVSTC
jgi:hypothetical protein